MEQQPPPKHAIELTIHIGAHDWEHAVKTAREIVAHVAEHGPACNLFSGGWHGCHSVDVEPRDVAPEQYRAELAAWLARAES